MLHVDTEAALSSAEGAHTDTDHDWSEIWKDEPGIAALTPQSFHAQLRAIAKEKNYSDGFAYRTFLAAVGHSPQPEWNTASPEPPSQAVTWWVLARVRQFQVLQRRLAADARRKAERGEPMLPHTEVVPKAPARKSQPKPKPALTSAQPLDSKPNVDRQPQRKNSAPPAAPPKPRNLPKSFDLAKPGHVEKSIEFVIACGGVTDWEARFMADITRWPHELSRKQKETLFRLIRRARKALN